MRRIWTYLNTYNTACTSWHERKLPGMRFVSNIRGQCSRMRPLMRYKPLNWNARAKLFTTNAGNRKKTYGGSWIIKRILGLVEFHLAGVLIKRTYVLHRIHARWQTCCCEISMAGHKSVSPSELSWKCYVVLSHPSVANILLQPRRHHRVPTKTSLDIFLDFINRCRSYTYHKWIFGTLLHDSCLLMDPGGDDRLDIPR